MGLIQISRGVRLKGGRRFSCGVGCMWGCVGGGGLLQLLSPGHGPGMQGVAQLGRARGLGPRGRRFESGHPDSPKANRAGEK